MCEKSENFSDFMTTCLNLVSLIGFQPIAPFVSAVNPLLQRILEKGFRLFNRDSTAKVECARLGIAYVHACDTINSKIQNGNRLRSDGFLDEISIDSYSVADEVIETTLRNTVQDAESKKAYLYGRFIGSFPFSEDLTIEMLIHYNMVLAQLSYREIEILHCLCDRNKHCFNSLENTMRENPSQEASVLFSSLLHLKSLGLLIQLFPVTLGAPIGNIKVSSIGHDLDRILSLDDVSNDLSMLVRQFDTPY